MTSVQNPAARAAYNTFSLRRAMKLRQRAIELDEKDYDEEYHHAEAVQLRKQTVALEQYADEMNARNFGITKEIESVVVNKTTELNMPNCYDDIQFERDDDQSPEEELREAMETVLKFGRHKGKTMRELVQKREGRSYLKWLANVEDENDRWSYTKDKCRIVLDFAEKAMKKWIVLRNFQSVKFVTL